jgi:hypothetical protein
MPVLTGQQARLAAMGRRREKSKRHRRLIEEDEIFRRLWRFLAS